MVRLINKKHVNVISNVLYAVLRIQETMTRIKEANNPNIQPCIYAMWHANQFSVHGLPNRDKVSVLISNSIDGEIVARVCSNWGFQVARGSSNRKGSISSTLHLIDKLKNGESVVIMVDGPHGPLHQVKNGAIMLAKETGVPIVPVHWYSPQKTFVHFPSWDKMVLPIGFCNILNTYGEPIYVSSDADEKVIAEQIKQSLEDLERRAPEDYKEAKKKTGLWNWK